MNDIVKEATTTATTLLDNFNGFLNHYSGELTNITHILSTVVNAIPLDSQEKDTITNLLAGLNDAIVSIQDSVARLAGSNAAATLGDVVVKKSDLVEIVKEVLPGILQELKANETASA